MVYKSRRPVSAPSYQHPDFFFKRDTTASAKNKQGNGNTQGKYNIFQIYKYILCIYYVYIYMIIIHARNTQGKYNIYHIYILCICIIIIHARNTQHHTTIYMSSYYRAEALTYTHTTRTHIQQYEDTYNSMRAHIQQYEDTYSIIRTPLQQYEDTYNSMRTHMTA